MSKIALISDSHDNIWHLDRALAAIQASGAELLLHCGDLIAPFIIGRMAAAFSGPIHIVFGNNDGDGRLLQRVASDHPHVTLHGIYAELAWAGRQVALIHYPEPALRIAQSGQFDLVAFGHTHEPAVSQIGACWLVNPGELMGMKGPTQWGIYDTGAHTYGAHELPADPGR